MKRKCNTLFCQLLLIGFLLMLGASCKKTPEYSLKVDIQPAGSGTVSLSPVGGKYEEGTEVMLTPNVTSTHKFYNWGGTDASFISNNKIVMSKDMTITANFEMLIPNGQWHGHYTGFEPTSNDIQFFIKDNKITKEGSALMVPGETATRSMIVNFYFSNVTITTYFSVDISITNNSFSYSSPDYKIAGNFTSATSCTGTAEYTGTGGQAKFSFAATSLPGTATLTTTTISDISQTFAKSGGNIINDGGSPVTARGVCWSTTLNPTIADNKTTDGTGTGAFTSTITGLFPLTIYYVRAYATNSEGTEYGKSVGFPTPPPVIPSLTTTMVSSITGTTAMSGGNVTSHGGSAVTARGICWRTSAYPTIINSKTTDGSGTGEYISSLIGLTMNTTYYVRAYAQNSVGTGYGNEVSFTTLALPSLTTTISSMTNTTAISGGNITDDGGSAILSRGTCWSTITNPTVADNKTIDGTGKGIFASSLTGLIANTTYYVRAYAINSVGTSYGNELILKTYTGYVTDFEGNTYYTVTVGTQLWMAENLKTIKYNDGSPIPLVTDNTSWVALSTPGYCWYNNDGTTNKATYGALYNWYTVNSISNGGKNVCPVGWHVPTDAEWTTLTTYLGGEAVAGGKLKEIGTTHWVSANIGATNESGFTALPGGIRNLNGTFGDIGIYGSWWSATESYGYAWGRTLGTSFILIAKGSPNIKTGISVRCLRD
jgi:uncharacterized protein (TIGR02145 family)